MGNDIEAQKKRRDYGEGSLTQRNDGRWMVRYHLGCIDGKTVIKSIYGKSETEVKRKLKEFKKELHKNDYLVVQKNTVQQYMENWFINVKKNELKPKSYDRLETTLKYQIYPTIGNIQIASITADDVQAMINKLRDEGKSYSTTKKAYDAINDCFRTGMIKKTVSTNPALGVTLPTSTKRDTSNIQYFKKEEAEKLIAAATELSVNGFPIFRLGYIIPFAIHTGLRISEMLGLKWSGVDLEQKTATITDTLVVVKNRDEDAKTKYKLLDQQDSTKSASGQRTIELNSKAYDALLHIKEITKDSTYVFETKNNRPITPRNINRLLHDAAIRAGFSEDRILGVHALRHTFATLLFAKGKDVKEVSEALGHADTTLTYNTYIDIIKEQKKDTVRSIEDF